MKFYFRRTSQILFIAKGTITSELGTMHTNKNCRKGIVVDYFEGHKKRVSHPYKTLQIN